MIIELLIFCVTSLVTYFLYVYKRVHWHFEKYDIKYLPGIPMLGNCAKSTFQKKHILHDILDVYNAFPEERYVGLIDNTTPTILVRDPELIKDITVKGFEHFTDHKEFFPPELDTMFGDSVFMMKGDRWRDMRTTLSPAFTGLKMRAMLPFMSEISLNIVEYLKENSGKEIDVDDLVRRYTNDVIASAGFGLQVNSLVDKDNEFFVLGQGIFKFTVMQRIQFVFLTLFPALSKKMGFRLFPKKTEDFFRNVVSSTIEFRNKNNVERPDMIQLLMEASKGTLKNNNNVAEKDDVGFATVNEVLKPQTTNRKWTLNELTGQVTIFFVAGFESSASAIVMCIHELALNPDIEEKLYQEIKQFKAAKGTLCYDNINQLKYLDCVLNETFRKWAAAIMLDRVCTKPYELPPPREGGKPYQLKPGDMVYNMVNAIHLDPKYFPNPEKFNPDRFSEENKHNIKPFSFMPFGMGPRNCVGSRFAILELKVFMYNLILNFKIVKSPKTLDPIKLTTTDFNIRAQGGTWVKFEPRA